MDASAISRPERPAFPKCPVDLDCYEPGPPRPDVVDVVRWVFEDFDPAERPNGWACVRRLLEDDGKSESELRGWTYEDVEMFFRANYVRLRQRLSGTIHFGINTNTPTVTAYNAGGAQGPSKPTRSKPRGETTAERLRELWKTNEGKLKILRAGIVGGAGEIGRLAEIDRKATAVKEAGPIWEKEILPALRAQKSYLRFHREEEKLEP